MGIPRPVRPTSFPLEQQSKFIACGNYNYTVGIKSNGTVVAVGNNNYGSCNVSAWGSIVSVACGDYHTAGLLSDGRCVAVGVQSGYDWGQRNVTGWRNIVAVACGSGHTVGLKSDGTVVAVGYKAHDECNVTDWEDIVSVACNGHKTVGLKSDGTVVVAGSFSYDVSTWEDIVAIDCGFSHVVGLKSNGTVVAVGNNKYGQCDVSTWKNIVAVACGYHYTMGIKSNGTVVAVGNNEYGQCDVSTWKNIVAVACGMYHTVDLRADGTVVAVGYNYYGQCDVGSWTLVETPKYDTTGLFEQTVSINLTDYTAVSAITVEGTQPTGTQRGFAFKVDDVYNKVNTDGTLMALPTQAIDVDSILAEGNTAEELNALTDVPSMVGKNVYPVIALQADTDAEEMPTAKLSFTATRVGEQLQKTEYSADYDVKGFEIYDYDLSTSVNDGNVIVSASYYKDDVWSEYAPLDTIKGLVGATKLRLKFLYTVTTPDGTAKAKINHLYIYARTKGSVVQGDTASLITRTQKFNDGMMYARLLVKHQALKDARIKAYVTFSDVPLKRENYIIGTGTGSQQEIALADKDIDFTSVKLYVNGNATYDFDFNSLTNTVTITADNGAVITASYDYEVSAEDWQEMTVGTTQNYQNGNYDGTDFSYMVEGQEKGASAIKIVLQRPDGSTTDEYLGVASGRSQTFVLKHFAKKETLSVRSGTTPVASKNMYYDEDTKKLTVIGLKDQPLYATYQWTAETPRVKGFVAAWNE